MGLHSSIQLGWARKQAATVYRGQGIAAGSVVLTMDGEIPVEFLSSGDRIITRDAGAVTIKAVHAVNVKTRAVKIASGTLGHTRPGQDVVIPDGQSVLIRDWRAQALFNKSEAMVAADRLIDGEYITSLGLRHMVLFQIELEGDHVIYADGLELACQTSAIRAAA